MKAESTTQVLMIDDDENDAMLVRHMLGKIPDSGCQLDWARSYEQGILKLAEMAWDLCLVDYQLGAHTGVEIVVESRARGLACPFLLLTGVGSRAIDLQAMRAGVVGYMEKSRLCPLELERAIRYGIGTRPAPQLSAGPASSHVPPEVTELLAANFASKTPFVVIALMLDRESALRHHFGPSHVDRISTELEALVRARISSGETLFRTSEGALLLVSSMREARDGRQFLSLLLAEPLAPSGGYGSRTVLLPAIVRRNVFTSADHLSPGALLSDLDTFFALRQLSHGYDLRPTALISDLHDFFAR
jgi:DNA-binding NarL/FixJ family response regulator